VPLKRSALHDGEVVVVEVRQHWSVTFVPVASAVVVVAAVSAVGIALQPLPVWTLWIAGALVILPVLRAGLALFRWSRHTVTLTSARIVVQRGGFSQEQSQLRLDRVIDVGFRQSIVDRLLGRGAVTVELEEGDMAIFPSVRRPKAFAHVVTAELNLRSGGSALAQRELAESVAELTSSRRAQLPSSEFAVDEEQHSTLELDRAAAALPPLARAELEVLLGQFEDGEISAAQFERERFALLQDYGIDPRSSR
jgi:uncharacterized membrane protein YdbT with pleckstrin-like domain